MAKALLASLVRLYSAALCGFSEDIIAPTHAARIDAEEKAFFIADIAEAAHQVGRYGGYIKGRENDEIIFFVLTPRRFCICP